MVLKTFRCPGYLHSENGVVWLWHPLVNFYIWLTILSCYGPITLAWGLIVRDSGLRTLCHSCGFSCQQRVLETFSGLGFLQADDGVVWLWHPLVNLYVWLTISCFYGSISLALALIGRDGGLGTLCHSCGLACHQKVLNTFAGSGYLHSEDGVVSLWHPVVNLYVWLTISSCYGPIPLALGLIVRDGGLSTLCHSCKFAYQQRMLKTFSGHGYRHFEDGVVGLWHPLVNLYIWLAILSCYGPITLALGLIVSDDGLNTLCQSCGFPCQQRVLKIFSGLGSLEADHGVVWLWLPLVNLYIWLTISSCHDSITLALGLIGKDVALSTLCDSCGFACQQKVLKTFPGPGYLDSEDG